MRRFPAAFFGHVLSNLGKPVRIIVGAFFPHPRPLYGPLQRLGVVAVMLVMREGVLCRLDHEALLEL